MRQRMKGKQKMFDEIESLKIHSFASDNYSGAHPEVLEAIAHANRGQQIAYGEDAFTARLHEVFAEVFTKPVQVFPVFNGTGANVVALQTMLPRWGSVICAQTAHVNIDEGGAPESVAGMKLLPVATPNGKLTPELIDTEAWGWGNEHRAQPSVVTITQSTEVGTVYTPSEVAAIAEHVHKLGMLLHMDGARISNAAAALDVPIREFTTDAGVDVVSLGGTKNGLLFGEAVVILNPAASVGAKFLRKTDMQLASKMRFISAQFLALFNDDLWLRSAKHANSMASRMRQSFDEAINSGFVTGMNFVQPTESNSLFAQLPRDVIGRLQEKHRFYDWDEANNVVRWVCSFDTREEDVDLFVNDTIQELQSRILV